MDADLVDPADDDPVEPVAVELGPADVAVDLDAVAADLADVERAMERIEAGTYWTDELTGAALTDELLAEHPTARRAADPPSPAPS